MRIQYLVEPRVALLLVQEIDQLGDIDDVTAVRGAERGQRCSQLDGLRSVKKSVATIL